MNQISGLQGIVFPAGLSRLDLVSFHDSACYVVGFRRYVACILWMFVQLHLISALDMQDSNRIASLKGVVFPAGLTKLDFVRFYQ